jgi:hypothetical protein
VGFENAASAVADQGIDEADARGWLVVDMKKDRRTIYPESAK